MSDKSGQFIKQWKEDVKQRDATIAALHARVEELKAKLERAETLLRFAWDDVNTASLRKQIFECMKVKP